jgi:UDP-N-acetylmuramate dehydrogenase
VSFRILGAGSNVVVRDTGVGGIVARLTGGDFTGISRNGLFVTAGAAASLSSLLGFLEKEELQGLEFLEGIPGVVGGAVRMNAGAWGHETAERIVSIRVLNSDGSERLVKNKDMGAAYRRCAALDKGILLEAIFRLNKGSMPGIRQVRDQYRQRREWMRGVRSAGSVFENPSSLFAGQLIEKAGLKGMSVGGVSVSMRHANVFVAGSGANASDFTALIDIVRDEVFDKFKVELRPEVEFFE